MQPFPLIYKYQLTSLNNYKLLLLEPVPVNQVIAPA